MERPHYQTAGSRSGCGGGTSTSGDDGTSTSGDFGTSTSGHYGILRIRWHDGSRYRDAVTPSALTEEPEAERLRINWAGQVGWFTPDPQKGTP